MAAVIEDLSTEIESTEATVLVTDNELLGKYLFQDDASALEELVRRHSGLIMGVCRHMLFHSHDAEDAFQATFLILSRKSRSLLDHGSIAGWLYQTAIRNCLQIRRRKGRARETEMMEEPVGTNEPWQTISEAQEAERIHQEINRLPKRYRDPIVLCHLQGHTRSEAAEFLDWTEAAVKAALSRGRNLLRRRLIRSGLMTSVAIGVLGTSTANAQTMISDSLIHSTLQHCCGITPTMSVGNGPHFVQSLSHTGVLSMQTATVIKSLSIAASIAIAAFVPLVLLAQQTELGGSESAESQNAIETGFELGESQVTPATVAMEIAGVASESNANGPATSDESAQQEVPAANTTVADGIGEDVPNLDAFDIYAGEVPVRAPGDFSIENSTEYWELILKSNEALAESFSKSNSKAKVALLEAAAKKYETQAKVVEARLNLQRIAAQVTKPTSSKPTRVNLNSNFVARKQREPVTEKVPGFFGSVLSVDDRGLLAISAGSDDGIRQGQRLSIYRDNRFLGESEVTKTNGDMSLLRVTKIVGEGTVRAGDKVMARLGDPGDEVSSPYVPSGIQKSTPDQNANPLLGSIPIAESIPPSAKTPVQPGEVLLVESMTDSSLNRRVVVRADHEISMPLVGSISVRGQTTREISKILDEKCSEYIKDPSFFVVRESASAPIKWER